MAYSRTFGSQFPQKVMELHNYQELTPELYPVVKKYSEYCASYNLEAASLLLAQYPDLAKCQISTNDINRFDEERYNTQLYALQKGQIVIVDEDEPLSPSDNLVWIEVESDEV